MFQTHGILLLQTLKITYICTWDYLGSVLCVLKVVSPYVRLYIVIKSCFFKCYFFIAQKETLNEVN